MKCTTVNVPGGGRAIICGSRPRARRCKACGCVTALAQLRERDWKIAGGKTCDRLICLGCTHVPAPGKDLCPEHAQLWKKRAEVHRGHSVAC